MEIFIIAFLIGAGIGVIAIIADIASGGKLMKTGKQKREEAMIEELKKIREQLEKSEGGNKK